MQFKKTTLSWLIFIIPAVSLAQSVNLPQGAKENWLLTRMDIKLMNDSSLSFSTAKPYLRKTMVEGIERSYPQDAAHGKEAGLFTPIDVYNMHDALMNSTEWVTGDISSFQSKKPILKAFYKTKGD